MFFIVWVFFIFILIFVYMFIVGLFNFDIVGGIFILIFIMIFVLCGVFVGLDDLFRFWVWVYCVNFLIYVIEVFFGIILVNVFIVCLCEEIVYFVLLNSSICDEYMLGYMSVVGGYFVGNIGESMNECGYCVMDSINMFFVLLNVSFDNWWRDFGFFWVYVVFNIFVVIGFYWFVRVLKKSRVVVVKV